METVITYLPIDYFLTPHKRIYLYFLMSSFLIALVFLHFKPTQKRLSFSRYVWLHPSAIIDYLYFCLIFIIKKLLIVPYLISMSVISSFVYQNLINQYGFQSISFFSYNQVLIIFTIFLFIINDFTRYCLHRAMHSFSWLWRVHKVHHSARVLTPFTFYRIHPIESILFGLRYAIITGIISGFFIYFFGGMVGIIEIIGVNVFLFLFNLLGANLRHSHIKLNYPKFLESLFISPYQHQIHHSIKYNNKNFGSYLAIWDKVFNTIVYSKEIKKIRIGLPKHESLKYDKVWKLLYQDIFWKQK